MPGAASATPICAKGRCSALEYGPQVVSRLAGSIRTLYCRRLVDEWERSRGPVESMDETRRNRISTWTGSECALGFQPREAWEGQFGFRVQQERKSLGQRLVGARAHSSPTSLRATTQRHMPGNVYIDKIGCPCLLPKVMYDITLKK